MKTEWVHKKLGDDDVAKIIMGQSPSSASYNDENIGLPFLQGCADFGEVFPKTSVYCNEPLKVAPQNSILMSVRAPVGTINKADQKYIVGRGLCSIVSLINNDYLYYYLLQNKNRLEQKAQGSTFLAINSAEVNDFDVSYPESLSTQRRIAAILTSADKVIAATQKTIAKYKQIKQGMMEDLLKPKEGWKMVKLGECCDKITDGCQIKPKCVAKSQFLMLSSQNIKDNKLDLSDVSYLTFDDFERENHRTNIKAGDVLLTIVGTVGRTYLVKENDVNFTLQRSVAVLAPKATLDSSFLLYTLNNLQFVLENEAHGCAQKGIYLKQLNQLLISIPDLASQRRIAAILSGIDAKIAAEEKVLQKYEKVKKGLMEKLLNVKN